MSWRARPLDVASAALLVVVLAPVLALLFNQSEGPAGEHGPVIVLVAGWLLWRERQHLRAAPSPRWTWVGGLSLAVWLWILLAARLDAFPTLELPAATAALASYLLARGGPSLLRGAWFPLVFLLFALPAPAPLLYSALVQMKLLAAHLACVALDPFVAVVRVGSTIHLTGAVLDVDEACSGLRGATGIAAFAALHGYLGDDRRRAIVSLVIALPVALVANVLRIIVLCCLALNGSSAAIGGPFHDGTGLAVYVIAMLAIIGISRLVPAREPAAPAEEVAPTSAPLGVGVHCALIAPLFAAAIVTLVHATVPTEQPQPIHAPSTIGAWSITPLELGPRVEEVLGGTATALRCSGPAGTADVLVARSRGHEAIRTFHAPDDCFIGIDFTVTAAEVRVLAGGLEVNRRVFRRGSEVVLVHFWNRVNGRNLLNPRSFRLETFTKRLRWLSPSTAMLVRVSTDASDGLEQADRRLESLQEGVLPALIPAH